MTTRPSEAKNVATREPGDGNTVDLGDAWRVDQRWQSSRKIAAVERPVAEVVECNFSTT
jgi:hypothetical protein